MGKTYLLEQDLTDYLDPDLSEQGFELHAKGRRDILSYQGQPIKEMKANYSVRVVNRYCRLWLAAKKEAK